MHRCPDEQRKLEGKGATEANWTPATRTSFAVVDNPIRRQAVVKPGYRVAAARIDEHEATAVLAGILAPRLDGTQSNSSRHTTRSLVVLIY